MRTSGRGGSEAFMFIAPAAIFGVLFLWLFGEPRDVVVAVDRWVLKLGESVITWLSTVWS